MPNANYPAILLPDFQDKNDNLMQVYENQRAINVIEILD